MGGWVGGWVGGNETDLPLGVGKGSAQLVPERIVGRTVGERVPKGGNGTVIVMGNVVEDAWRRKRWVGGLRGRKEKKRRRKKKRKTHTATHPPTYLRQPGRPGRSLGPRGPRQPRPSRVPAASTA